MSHTSFLSPKNNNKITSYVFQLYSMKGLIFQSSFYTNLDTLRQDAFLKYISYNEQITMRVLRYE